MELGKATVRIEMEGIDEALKKLQELESKLKSIREMCPGCPCRGFPWYPPVNVPSIWVGDLPPYDGTMTITYTSGTTQEKE